MANPGKIPTDGGGGLGHNPFAGLSGAGLPVAPKTVIEQAKANTTATTSRKGGTETRPTGHEAKNRGRVEIKRETGGRGGKTVTVVSGFVGIGLPEKEQLAKKIRGACGCGGTVKDGTIEIQGDQRETVARILREAGFRPVFAGG